MRKPDQTLDDGAVPSERPVGDGIPLAHDVLSAIDAKPVRLLHGLASILADEEQ